MRFFSHTRSVEADLLERDFLLLLESLAVNPDALPMLAQALEHYNQQNQPEGQIAAIQAEITYWRQRAKNADILFLKARITEDEWRETLQEAEHEIARLQSQIAQRHEAEFALKLTGEMVADLVSNWKGARNEMRRTLAYGLFEYLVYDLDAQQIVDFKLKPWASMLMQLKITLDESADSGSATDGKLRVLWCSRRALGTCPPPRRRLPFGAFWSSFIAE